MKGAQQAANGPVWMAPALKTHCVILFWSWENPLFPLLALWGNKNWLPSMKGKKLENYQNKRGLTGCKWSSLNSSGTENPLTIYFCHFICLWPKYVCFVVPVWMRARVYASTRVRCCRLKPAFDTNKSTNPCRIVELKSDFCHVKCQVCEEVKLTTSVCELEKCFLSGL